MLAERLKLSVKRTYNHAIMGLKCVRVVRASILSAGIATLMIVSGGGDARAQYSPAGAKTPTGTTYASPEAAYEHGRGAMQGGHPELAIKPFEYAAEKGVFLAQFYLARIYADNTLIHTDHGRAFELYQAIVTDFGDVDVDDDPRAPFIAKAMVALADYYRSGIPSASVSPDLEQTANLLRSAAKSLRDEDAQYELAKLLLKGGEGVTANPREAIYWLRKLSQLGHTSAQAFLADLYWRGQHVEKDKTQALLLITLAVENAPAAERVWIEDKYQNIFCGAGEGVRRQTQGAVADWRNKYGRPREDRVARDGLASIQPRTQRTCSNGEAVLPGNRGDSSRGLVVDAPTNKPANPSSGFAAAPMPGANIGSGFMQGNAGSFGMRDTGQSVLTPPR